MNVTSIESTAASPAAANVPAGITKRQVALPLLIFAAGFSVYSLCILGAVLATNLGAKIGLSVLGGVFIANLAIIGHDAVHKSFTRLRWLNRVIGTVALLPALHPYTRWEHHHNRVHHRYTAQIGVDNAYPPMTIEQYRAASPGSRLYYRFMRSLLGQPFFYMVDVWLPSMFLPSRQDTKTFNKTDWADLGLVYLWLLSFIAGLAGIAQAYSEGAESFADALANAALFGFLIPFLVWNLFISFVTIVQHTSPKARWILPPGRPSTYEQKLRGTVHVGFPEFIDWFFHRVMQHLAHHVNPVIPLYALKSAEQEVIAQAPERPAIEVWTPAYHWRMTRDCKLYDPTRDCWCGFDFQPTGQRVGSAIPARVH